MKRAYLIILAGIFSGLGLFIGFNLFTFFEVLPFGESFNNFFSMIGLILFFISGFFYISAKTMKK
jgi:hypothetical protein